MSAAIPYLVKKGDTLESISSDLGINDSYDLRTYHNMNSEVKDGIGADVVEEKTLLTPPKEKIDAMNAQRTELEKDDKAESEKKEEQKKEDQKKEEEKKKEAAKSEHDDKYYVVHGATCACDKAENPKQTAKLVVTSQKKVILNDQEGKFFATEADKTFDPPAATFGKCKLQPSFSGYLPCTLSPAPKWSKVYEKTQVLGNKALTQLSTLQCTIGGKIEIVKHGQTDSVMKEHADNTNPAALALINPAVKMPVPEMAYPSISNITLKSLENYSDFKPVSSAEGKKVELVLVRPNTECTFEAKVKRGNVALTSWVIYDGHTGDKDKKLLTSEQIGTSFKNSFPALGKYRVEGYGKPKKEDFEKGNYNKNFPDCSIDIEVTNNKLVGKELLPIEGENFAKIIGGKMRLRQNFRAHFMAKFLMPPTNEELERLQLNVTDASGNILDSMKMDRTISFTPKNTKAQYKIIAEYKLDSGEVLTQSFTAETISNSVSGITHNAEVIRPGTAMSFSVKEGTFSFYVPNDEVADVAIGKELQQVKWNLNGRLLGSGKSISIPGHEFISKGKYVVEAYVQKANAYGAATKDEDDDWRFEVKDNDVLAFSCVGIPKVGKTTKLEANSFVFQKALDAEHIIWKTAIPHKTIDKKTISITPVAAGKQNVQCAINREPGITSSIDVKQGKVLGMFFTDSNGIEIQRASWGQKINIWVQQEHLVGEDLTIEIWDNDAFKNDYCKVINVPKYDGNLIPFTLDSYVRGKAGDWGMLYVKIAAPKLKLANTNNVFESKNHLNVEDIREIYGAHIGSQDGKDRHYHADYDKISYFYGKSRGIKKEEQLNLTIYEKDKKLLEATNVHADESGMIKIKLDWSLINPKLPMCIVYAVVKDKDGNVLYNGARNTTGPLVISKKSALLSLAEYKSAVLVGSEGANGSKKDANGVCECEAKVRAFMRMLRVGEGTENEIGYETIVGGSTFKDHGKNFDNHPNVYIKKHDSRAAGAYQITMNNWNDVAFVDWRKEHGLTDFKPESQDKYCVYLIKEKKKALGLIKKDNIKEAIDKCRTEWASLPGAGYGQREEDIDNILKKYKQYYEEELKGPTNHLHIKKGFLKEFGEECCEEESIVVGVINKYRIDVDVFTYSKIMKCLTSNKYQYDIYENNKLIKTITVEKNDHNLLPFPETGINWGRFGPRDKGGDNWVNEKVCAALLGFFFSLPKNGYSEALYFNDISANDGRDIGHKGHNIAGNDIDIRYPGSSNAGRTLWSDAMNKYKTEEEFVKVLENIISVGVKWGFNKNYAYKKDIKNTTGKSTSVHQDHFHLGLR
jgi:muramidase (phage lysozyme)